MNYKRLVFIIILFFGIGIQYSFSQATATKDKMEAIKIGFLTERLDLTPEQAKGFWPLYNEYTAKRKELKSKIGALGIESRLEQLTEDQISQELKQIYMVREAELELEKEYMQKFTRFISNRKVAKLYKAEREFVKILLKKLEEK